MSEPSNGNGTVKRCALMITGGIPLAVIVAWIFYAGASKEALSMTQNQLAAAIEMNHRQESRLTRLETVYDKTAEDIREIKEMVRAMR